MVAFDSMLKALSLFRRVPEKELADEEVHLGCSGGREGREELRLPLFEMEAEGAIEAGVEVREVEGRGGVEVDILRELWASCHSCCTGRGRSKVSGSSETQATTSCSRPGPEAALRHLIRPTARQGTPCRCLSCLRLVLNQR